MKPRQPETDDLRVKERIRLLALFPDDPRLRKLVSLGLDALHRGGKILVFGNGGSATQASHFVAELVNRFYLCRSALPAISLAADAAVLTSVANDDAYARVFSRQVEALGKPGDLALGLTTSGRSANVLEAIREAKARGLTTVVLCGREGGEANRVGADLVLAIDSGVTPIIQEMHLFVLHHLAEQLEIRVQGETHG